MRIKRLSMKVWSGAFPQVIGLKSAQASVGSITSEAIPPGSELEGPPRAWGFERRRTPRWEGAQTIASWKLCKAGPGNCEKLGLLYILDLEQDL